MKLQSITVDYLDNKNRITHTDRKVYNPQFCPEFTDFKKSLRLFCHKKVRAEDRKYIMTIRTVGGGQGAYMIPYTPYTDYLRETNRINSTKD